MTEHESPVVQTSVTISIAACSQAQSLQSHRRTLDRVPSPQVTEHGVASRYVQTAGNSVDVDVVVVGNSVDAVVVVFGNSVDVVVVDVVNSVDVILFVVGNSVVAIDGSSVDDPVVTDSVEVIVFCSVVTGSFEDVVETDSVGVVIVEDPVDVAADGSSDDVMGDSADVDVAVGCSDEAVVSDSVV